MLRRAAAARVLHACVNQDLRAQGMGQVLLSGELPDGKAALVTRDDADVYGRLLDSFDMVTLTPACARRPEEGAVENAHNRGLPP